MLVTYLFISPTCSNYNEFAAGKHTISRSGQPFLQVSTDMTLEQSINNDSKSSGGVIGISQVPSALERWFLTIHERASITSALKAMYGFQDANKHRTRKQLRGESNETRKT